MSKRKLILLASSAMDNNSGKDEDSYLRLAAVARASLQLSKDSVEVWASGEDGGTHVPLKIYKAFLEDIRIVNNMVKRGEVRISDALRVGFVTTKMWRRLYGYDPDRTIWVSDTKEKVEEEEILIGTDPEFLLFDDHGKVIAANKVMPKEGEIGSDGAMAELRPKPSTTPDGLIKNIASLLSNGNLTSKIQPYEWRAACYHKDTARDYGIGGHIHVGNPSAVAKLPMSKREIFFNVLNKIIDELLAVPMTRIDGELGKKRRTQCAMSNGNGGWGYFGEWRTANGRLEHRTLSGLWLSNPQLAKHVIGVAKAITEDAFKRWANENYSDAFISPKGGSPASKATLYHHNFKGWGTIPICCEMQAMRDSSEMRCILNESDASLINKGFLTKWVSSMKELSTYTKYEKHIVGLKNLLEKSSSSSSKEHSNLKKTWVS